MSNRMNVKSKAIKEYLKVMAIHALTFFTMGFLLVEFGFHWLWLIVFPLWVTFLLVYGGIKIGGILCPHCSNVYGVQLSGVGIYIPPKCSCCGAEDGVKK